MPEWHCPKCDVTLREDDMATWNLPFQSQYDDYPMNMVQVMCWNCTWKAAWKVEKFEFEVVAKEEETA